MMVAEKPALGFQAHGDGDDELELELASPAPPPRKMHSLEFEHIGSLAAVAESLAPGSRWQRALTSVRVVIFQAKINVLLPFGPLAIMLHYLSGTHVRTPAPHFVSYIFLLSAAPSAFESLLASSSFKLQYS
jgi:Ca2+:H+ antiporter